MLKDYQEQLLKLLEQLEISMSNLYKLFVEKYPQYKELWIYMSQQEMEHAGAVKKLTLMAQDGKLFFDEKLTRTYTVKKVLDTVKETYAQAESNQLSLIGALSVSRDFEQSILEKEFYNYFSGNDPDVRILLHRLKQETMEHQSRVKDAWEQERKIALRPLRKI
ncbi:MAG: hypothetical protein K4571_05860 [Deltaproteobacteria bacterium]